MKTPENTWCLIFSRQTSQKLQSQPQLLEISNHQHPSSNRTPQPTTYHSIHLFPGGCCYFWKDHPTQNTAALVYPNSTLRLETYLKYIYKELYYKYTHSLLLIPIIFNPPNMFFSAHPPRHYAPLGAPDSPGIAGHPPSAAPWAAPSSAAASAGAQHLRATSRRNPWRPSANVFVRNNIF